MEAFWTYLSAPMVEAWGAALSHLEVFGFVTGVCAVILTVRKNILNFPVGILNSLLLGLLFFHSSLFADAGLQLVFIALGLMGWWQWWLAEQTPLGEGWVVLQYGSKQRLAWLVFTGVLIALMYPVLLILKGDVPFFDAAITAMSIVAQILLNRRYLENWWVWIAVDMVSIPVYLYKELYLIALLYTIFLGLACAGLLAWRAQWRSQRGLHVLA